MDVDVLEVLRPMVHVVPVCVTPDPPVVMILLFVKFFSMYS